VEVDTPFTDNEGETAYKILRYYRPVNTTGWGSPEIAVAKRTPSGLETVIQNTRYLNLAFPVEKDRTWDGNTYNHIERKEEYNYRYTDVHRPLQLNDKRFDSALTVEQVDVKSPIERFYIIERYAAGVGLVYRQEVDTNRFKYLGNDPVLDGYINRQTLVSYKVR
jgi:hypothetical protein